MWQLLTAPEGTMLQPNEWNVRAATPQDWKAMWRIHTTALGESLLPMFGYDYISTTVYHLALQKKEACAFVLEKEGAVAGFIIYGSTPTSIKAALKTQKRAMAKALFTKAISFDTSFFATFLRVSLNKSKNTVALPQNTCHLFLIGIHPDLQGKNLGKTLMRTTLPLAGALFNVTHCVVEARTEGARRFYLQNGFSLHSTEHIGNREYCRLLCPIPEFA